MTKTEIVTQLVAGLDHSNWQINDLEPYMSAEDLTERLVYRCCNIADEIIKQTRIKPKT